MRSRLGNKNIQKDARELRVLLGQGTITDASMPDGTCWLHCEATENTFGGANAAGNLETGGGGGDYNVALGWGAMRYNVTGDYNVCLGAEAGEGTSGQSHSGDIAIGYQAMHVVTTGSHNVVIGYMAGVALTTGRNCVIIGRDAGTALTSADNTVYIGNGAGRYNINGDIVTAVGAGAGESTAGKFYRQATLIGYCAGYKLEAGVTANDCFVGGTAGGETTTGTQNTGIGEGAMGYNTTGSENTAVGFVALEENTTGEQNTVIGEAAMEYGDPCSCNCVMGWEAANGYSAVGVAHDYNVYIGAQAAFDLTTASCNVGVGYRSLYGITTGTYNVALGWTAGDLITTGTYNICIGPGMDPPANNSNYRINIGDTIFGDWAANVKTVGINRAAIAAQLDVYQDQAAGAIPVLKLEQKDVSEEFIRFVGTSANAVLTQSIVEDADVSTATRAGWVKVYVQDDGDQLTDQAYFLPVYSLT